MNCLRSARTLLVRGGSKLQPVYGTTGHAKVLCEDDVARGEETCTKALEPRQEDLQKDSEDVQLFPALNSMRTSAKLDGDGLI